MQIEYLKYLLYNLQYYYNFFWFTFELKGYFKEILNSFICEF